VFILFVCFYLPCSSKRGKPGLSLEITSKTKRTYLQVEMKTKIFDFVCDFRNENRVSSLSFRGTTI